MKIMLIALLEVRPRSRSSLACNIILPAKRESLKKMRDRNCVISHACTKVERLRVPSSKIIYGLIAGQMARPNIDGNNWGRYLVQSDNEYS